ncbi:Transposon Ty3-I Gag-Pol polyprotein [Senna tora]|uniref:Transposon Ty3-I Gag-Pol polyprotein n=1 Tax=Senna tora TaxID=362788 RepID=A0A834TUE8_9FABA|nr:Transposon Ty3-I Gag-Pol polyprotein [Senna tora]
MVKLGWGLINQKDALWARVLKAKYKCGDDLIPKVDRSSSASRLWNGIAGSWKHVQDGMVWRMGPLSVSDLSMVLADFVSASGGWEWSKFDFLLPNEICNMVVAVLPPSNVGRGDQLAWKHSRDVVMSMRVTNSGGCFGSGEPEVGWVKFNVDGARKDNLILTACGGIAQDSTGCFLTGFVRKLGDGNVLNAELWSILGALEVAWFAGIECVMLTDSEHTKVEGPSREQQMRTSDGGPFEKAMRRSIRMKKPTWKCSGKDNTRAKDLAARLDKMQETMDECEARYAAHFDQMEKAVGSFDRLEKTVESIARAVDALTGSMERLKLPDSDSDKTPSDQQALVPQPYQPFHTRSVKLDFPRFNGSDPLHWLFKAEKFFAYYETPDDQRVTIAAVHFEGVVVPWFQMMCKSSRFDSWVALSKAIEVEFGPSQFESPRALLFKLYQKTSVAEFYREFMILATRVEGISDEALLDCFVSGLKPTVHRDVIAQAPSSLHRASALACLFDERSSFGFSASSSKGSFTAPVSIVPVPSLQASVPLSSSTSLIEDDEEGEPPTLDVPPDAPSTEPSLSDPPPHHLSLNVCEHAVGTIRFTGKIHGVDVQVLLDGGSFDNFIQPRLVRTLKLAVEPISPFKVLVGNGHVLTDFSVVKSIPMLIQGHEITVSTHVLEVTCADIILGAQWLATLGPHIADYSIVTIKFYCAGHFITLHGEPKPVAKVA